MCNCQEREFSSRANHSVQSELTVSCWSPWQSSSLYFLCCKCTIPTLSWNPLNGRFPYLEYTLTTTVAVIWSIPKPCVLKQFLDKWKQSLLLLQHRRLCLVVPLRCWVYDDSLITCVDKNQQGQSQHRKQKSLVLIQISELHCKILHLCETLF